MHSTRYGNGLISENGDYYYDEINLIQKGGNYGFPIFQPANVAPEISNSTLDIKPLRSYWDTIAPTQMIYYHGDKIPLLKDKFILGTYQGDIYVLRLDTNSKKIIEEVKINFENYPFKPIVGIAESPQGDLYFGAYNIWKLNSIDNRYQENNICFLSKQIHLFLQRCGHSIQSKRKEDAH